MDGERSSLTEDYPRTIEELELRFSSEGTCRDYLWKLRWPNGFHCPRCLGSRVWPTGRSNLFECGTCHHQISITAGTVFEGSRKPLVQWFRAIWWMTNEKNGASALGLQRVLGLGSYQTAWAWLHKLRRAMVRPGRELLTGRVEVDETYFGGPRAGARGRGAENKALIAIAAEENGNGIGRIRMARITDVSGPSLEGFIQANVAPGTIVHSDAWLGYNGLSALGYVHEVTNLSCSDVPAHVVMPIVHRVASLLTRWILGTHQGAVSHKHLEYYLDEFTFRFNRRTSKSRGKLFYRLLQQAVNTEVIPYSSLVGRTSCAEH